MKLGWLSVVGLSVLAIGRAQAQTPAARELLPTNQSITPTAAAGARFTTLIESFS